MAVRTHKVRAERRWPMAMAVVIAVALMALLPSSVRPESRWLVVSVGLLLIALVIADPGPIDRSTRVVRLLSRAVLTLLALAAMVSTALLIHELVAGEDLSKSATRLLLVGNAVWLANNIVFGLLYWELDGGGAAARAFDPAPHPDFGFPQHMNAELAPAGWRPIFVDYLYLAFNNALAFSPTDAMPLARWAKCAMAVQALVSVAILGLVVARAVNVFS